MANSPNTPSYPANSPAASLDFLKHDLTDDIMAAHVNDLDDEVIALAAVLGFGVGTNDPKTAAGGYANGTHHQRLRALEAGKENVGVAQSLLDGRLNGAFSMGGAGGNRVDFDGDTGFQARRVSDGAPVDMYLNWTSGGRVIARDLYTNYLYNEGTVDAAYLQSRGNINAAGTSYIGGLADVGGLSSRGDVHVVNSSGVFDNDHAADWSTAQVRAGAIGGSGNAMFSVWALSTAAIIKWYSGNGFWEFRNSDDSGYVNIKASNISPSSRRFKENIQPLERGLEDILRLVPVTYTPKSARLIGTDGEEVEPSVGWAKLHETPMLGLIAEDVEEVVPEVVGYDDDGVVDSLQYDGLVPLLIKGMQEQQAQIQSLMSRIEELEGEAGLVR